MKKFTYLTAVALLAVTTLTACGSKTTNTTENVTAVVEETTPAAEVATEAATEAPLEEAKTITVEHSLGTVEVPLNPSKAVIMDLGILDTVQELGVEAELAVPAGNLPEYLSAYNNNTNAGSVKEPDLETIFEFEPEVIIISGRQSSYYDQLSEIAPVVFVEIDSKNYMADFEKNTRLVAEIFGKEDLVDEKITAIQKQVEEVQAVTANLEEKGLILLVNDGSISAYGSGSRFGMIHDLLGIKTADDNIEVSTHGMEANFEYISEVNPDLLFVVDRSEATGSSEKVEGVPALDNELVNKTTAAQNGKIIKLDGTTWYLTGGGISSVSQMINEIAAGLNK